MGLLEEQAREVLHIGPLIVTVLARRDETGVDFGQNRGTKLIFGKAPVGEALRKPAAGESRTPRAFRPSRSSGPIG